MNSLNSPKIKVRVMDAAWLRRTVSCTQACPIHTSAEEYVSAIARGDFDSAYAIAKAKNPFINICSRVCSHPCEGACRRALHDEPVSIRALKRSAIEYRNQSNSTEATSTERVRNGMTVAVVGAGPAGISAAHDLGVLGYDVTLFEASDQLGGLLRFGVPEFRLPHDVLDAELESILRFDIKVVKNARLGRDVRFADLRRDFGAVFLGIGAYRVRERIIEGADSEGVSNGTEFLFRVNSGEAPRVGQKVVVVGAGNVALDVARSAMRCVKQQRATYSDSSSSARESEVHLVCLKSVHEMSSNLEDLCEAQNEGITLHDLVRPVRILSQEGKCAGIELVQVVSSVSGTQSEANQDHAESRFIIECDTIVLTARRIPDVSFLGEDECLDQTMNQFVDANPESLETNLPGVYVGGDACFGTRTVIDAIADGRRAAASIHRYLSGQSSANSSHSKPKLTPLPMSKMPEAYDRSVRVEEPTISPTARSGNAEVQVGYSREQAIAQASRCLRCSSGPVLDESKCVLCGGCVDICPFGCLRFVDVRRLESDKVVDQLAVLNHGKQVSDLASEVVDHGNSWYALVKNEDLCNRCGLCIERCPVGALWMGQFTEEACCGG